MFRSAAAAPKKAAPADAPVRVRSATEQSRIGFAMWCRAFALAILLVSFMSLIFYASTKMRNVEDVIERLGRAFCLDSFPPSFLALPAPRPSLTVERFDPSPRRSAPLLPVQRPRRVLRGDTRRRERDVHRRGRHLRHPDRRVSREHVLRHWRGRLVRDRSIRRAASRGEALRQARSIHWSPYDPVRVVNAVP